MPVMAPAVASMVTVEGALDVQAPEGSVSVRVATAPTHTLGVPAMAAGCAFTVTTVVMKHPVFAVAVITAVPADTPVTTLLAEPIEATAELLLDHDCSGDVASASVVVPPIHIDIVPVIGAGVGLTVALTERTQPLDEV